MSAWRMSLMAICIAASWGPVAPYASAANLTITWEVENRFRFYRDKSAFENYKKTALELQNGPRADWILRTERKLQDAHRDKFRNNAEVAWNGWASLTRDDTCWDRQRHVWTNIDRCTDYVLPVSHPVIARAEGAAPGAQCQWQVTIVGSVTADLWKRRQANNQHLATPVPCTQAVTVEVPYSSNNETDPARGGFQTKLTVTAGSDSKEEIIQVTDLLVVGMGDSFAAGVGNPDKPARINWGSHVLFKYPGKGDTAYPARFGGGENAPASSLAGAQAEWLDIRCFRSQYGAQFRAALQLAVSLRHSAVTYLDLACNGARVIEGLLHSKTLDVGYARGTERPPSQIATASRLLCAQKKLKSVAYRLVAASSAAACRNLGRSQICDYGDKENGVFAKYQNDARLSNFSMSVCDASNEHSYRRHIDALLLSIGGNDIGFAPMVADVMIDNQERLEKLLAKLANRKGISHPGDIGLKRLDLLNSKYAVLNRAISEYLPWKPGQKNPDQKKPVFLTAYPMPLDDSSGQVCGLSPQNVKAAGAAFDVSTLFENFGDEGKPQVNRRPLSLRLREVMKASCALNLRRFGWMDGGSNAASIVAELTGAGALCAGHGNLAAASATEAKIPWQYVGDFLPAYRRHGFCAHQAREPQSALSIPRKEFTKPNREWSPWKPVYDSAHPYRSRERWLRTPNDAFVITNWHAGHTVDDYANLLVAATTTSMHPTAEGFAAMADAVLGRVTKYLCAEGSADFKKEPACSGGG